MANRPTTTRAMFAMRDTTEIEEVYCDLDRVVSALDLVTAQKLGAAGAVVELLREKVFASARRLESLVNGGR